MNAHEFCPARERENRGTELVKYLRGWWRREEGQGLVEYSLIIAMVGVAIVGVLTLLSGGIQNSLNNVISSL